MMAAMSGAAQNPDVRWKQRFHSFRQALGRLREAVLLTKKRNLSDLERQGMIQAFEFTHELAWNTLRDYLKERGETALHGSKDATRKAFQIELITDGDVWMEMIESRNRSTHTYNELTAIEIAGQITNSYFDAFEKFEKQFEAVEKTSA
jgi:nucleotidyltransferase substrate binding protein (TIGR01987 family)